MSKLFTPRYMEGREYEAWVREVSKQIGVSPPATLEELGQESVVPILAKLHDLESELASMKKLMQSSRSENESLRRRISDIERSI